MKVVHSPRIIENERQEKEAIHNSIMNMSLEKISTKELDKRNQDFINILIKK